MAGAQILQIKHRRSDVQRQPLSISRFVNIVSHRIWRKQYMW